MEGVHHASCLATIAAFLEGWEASPTAALCQAALEHTLHGTDVAMPQLSSSCTGCVRAGTLPKPTKPRGVWTDARYTPGKLAPSGIEASHRTSNEASAGPLWLLPLPFAPGPGCFFTCAGLSKLPRTSQNALATHDSIMKILIYKTPKVHKSKARKRDVASKVRVAPSDRLRIVMSLYPPSKSSCEGNRQHIAGRCRFMPGLKCSRIICM